MTRIDSDAAIKTAVFENSLPSGSVDFIPPGGGIKSTLAGFRYKTKIIQ